MKTFARLLVAIIATSAMAPPQVSAEVCFAIDADDVYDKDGVANGIITVTAASQSSVPAAKVTTPIGRWNTTSGPWKTPSPYPTMLWDSGTCCSKT